MTDDLDVSEQRKEFHEQRATVIGATDSPKILGLSKHGTALSVYNEKIDPVTSDRQMSLPAWLGLKMESAVAELYTAETGHRVRADNKMHVMPGYDFIGCHLDFRRWGDPLSLVEAKTRAYMKGWGDAGTKRIPVDIWVQVQHEMMVTGGTGCDVAVLFGHHTFRVYEIERDAAFIETLLERLIRFREDNWLVGVPPMPTGHPVDLDIVKSETTEHDDIIKPLTPEQSKIVEQFRRAQINVKQAAERESELTARLIKLIGDNAGISGPFGTVTYRRTKDGTKTEWEQVASSYRSWIEAVGLMPPGTPADFPVPVVGHLDAIESLYTRVKPGYRRFNYQFAEETEDA